MLRGCCVCVCVIERANQSNGNPYCVRADYYWKESVNICESTWFQEIGSEISLENNIETYIFLVWELLIDLEISCIQNGYGYIQDKKKQIIELYWI